MHLARFDPFAVFRDLDRAVGDWAPGWLPRIDVFDRESQLVVRLEVAGVSPDDISVTIEDRTLTISGSREVSELGEGDRLHRREIRSGGFKRTIGLPDGLDADQVKATADNGILEISIPRSPEVLPRKIAIEVAG